MPHDHSSTCRARSRPRSAVGSLRTETSLSARNADPGLPLPGRAGLTGRSGTSIAIVHASQGETPRPLDQPPTHRSEDQAAPDAVGDDHRNDPRLKAVRRHQRQGGHGGDVHYPEPASLPSEGHPSPGQLLLRERRKIGCHAPQARCGALILPDHAASDRQIWVTLRAQCACRRVARTAVDRLRRWQTRSRLEWMPRRGRRSWRCSSTNVSRLSGSWRVLATSTGRPRRWRVGPRSCAREPHGRCRADVAAPPLRGRRSRQRPSPRAEGRGCTRSLSSDLDCGGRGDFVAPDLDRPCQPFDDEPPVSLRWILLHLLEETARHAGHADILRELVDGKTGR